MLPDLADLESRIAALNGNARVDRRVHLTPDIIADIRRVHRAGLAFHRYPLIRQTIARIDRPMENVRFGNDV